LVAENPYTWTATVPPGQQWVDSFEMTVASGYDGICTNTMTFTSLEGPQGEVSVSFNVVGAITSTVTPEAGGELVYSDDDALQAEITVPAGAVSETTTLSYIPLGNPGEQPTGMFFAGQAFDLSAYQDGQLIEDFFFEAGSGITVTLHYTDSDLEGLDPAGLALYTWTGTEWSTDGITRVGYDAEAHTVSFWVTHLTDFGLFAPEGKEEWMVYLPMVIQ
jgi:hypothetical protein